MTDSTSTAHPRIVVGVDGSPQSKDALRWAARLAQLPTDGPAPVIQAVIAWEFSTAAYGFVSGMPDVDLSKESGQVLAETVKETFPEGAPAGLVELVSEGPAAQVIVELSRGAQVTVVGSRGHGGFTGMLIGSVSGRVAEYAHSPVMVVHGEKDRA